MTFLSLKNDANVLSKSNKQENLRKAIFVDILRRKEQDPDSYVSGTDPRIRTKLSRIHNCLGGFNSIVELIPRKSLGV
jgi:hypothetical protein